MEENVNEGEEKVAENPKVLAGTGGYWFFHPTREHGSPEIFEREQGSDENRPVQEMDDRKLPLQCGLHHKQGKSRQP
jgi:hypothetical protein